MCYYDASVSIIIIYLFKSSQHMFMNNLAYYKCSQCKYQEECMNVFNSILYFAF